MKLFAILAAVCTIATATTYSGLNVMGQQKMTGLMGMMERQGMMENPRMMTYQSIPMSMQKSQEMMKEQISQRVEENQRIGLYNTKDSQNEQKITFDMTEQVRQMKIQRLLNNIETLQKSESMVNLDQIRTLGYQIAEEIVQQVMQKELAEMQQLIKRMQQAPKMMITWTMFQQMAQEQAVQEIKKDMMELQEEVMQPNQMNKMQQTLQIVVEAEIALKNVQYQQNIQNPFMALRMTPIMYNFRFIIQQLMNENNIEQTKALISKHENKIGQLQLQIKLLTQQLEELQVSSPQQNLQSQQMILHLQVVEKQMQQQQQQLMMEMMVHQTVINQLQQLLLDQQNQLQQPMASQQTLQYLNQKKYPMMMMSSMNMPRMMQA